MTLKDIWQSAQKLFNDDKGFFQRGHLTAQPIRQFAQQAPRQTIRIAQQAPQQVGNFFNRNVAQPIQRPLDQLSSNIRNFKLPTSYQANGKSYQNTPLAQKAVPYLANIPQTIAHPIQRYQQYNKQFNEPERQLQAKKITPEDYRKKTNERTMNLAMGFNMGLSETRAFSPKQIEMVKSGFTKEVRDLLGKFAQHVEDNPGANRQNLGKLGEYVHSLATTVFGKDAANLTNKQLKNAFDALMQQAEKSKITPKFRIGLGTQNVREGAKPQPLQGLAGEANIKQKALQNTTKHEPEFRQYVGSVYDEFGANKSSYLKQAQSIDPNITDVKLGGSYGRGTPNPNSDIDLHFSYNGTPPKGLMEKLQNKFYLGNSTADVGVVKTQDFYNQARGGVKPPVREPIPIKGTQLVEENLAQSPTSRQRVLPQTPRQTIKIKSPLGDSISQPPPSQVSSNPTDIWNSLREARGKFDLGRDQEFRKAQENIKYWDNVNPEERVAFIQRMEEGAQQPTPELQQMADAHRAAFEVDYQLGQRLKPDLPYRENYFAHSGIWKDPKRAEEFYSKWARETLGGSPGALKQRSFPTINDGIQAGLELKETNPATIALRNRVALMKGNMAQDFIEEQRAAGADMNQVMKHVDRFLERGLQDSKIFQNYRSANNVLNSIDLGLSGFHITGTAINATVTKGAQALLDLKAGRPFAALGDVVRAPTAAIEYVMRGHQIMKDLKAGNITSDILRQAEGGGRIGQQNYYKVSGLEGAFNAMKQDFYNKKYISGTVKAPFRAIFGTLGEVMKPVMDFYVPRLKAGAAADIIDHELKNLGPNATPQQIRATKALVVDSIDNRFGQLTMENLAWKKWVKDLTQSYFRSAGWNIGTAREIGGGALDVIKGTQKGRLTQRSAYTVSLAITTATMGAMYQYLKTGKGPESVKDLFYPRTGQADSQGREERVSFPTYAKDVYGFSQDPVQTIVNKQAPLIHDASVQMQGKNYFGDPIYDKNAPLSAQLRQRGAAEIAGHIPFSITSGAKRVNPNAETTIESFMGINKAPGSVMGGYYDTKGKLDAKLTPDQKQVADYLTASSQFGGPSSKDKASVIMKNDWALDYYKNLQLESDKNHPLWSMDNARVKDYLAYELMSDTQQKAQMRVRDPWIPQLQRAISDYYQSKGPEIQQAQQDKQNSPQGKIDSFLGVYKPKPTTPFEPFEQGPPNPMQQLTQEQVRIVSAYTAAEKGSAARKQLLAQNPWLKAYWDANAAFYEQNPIDRNDPLSQYLKSIGIDPNSSSASGGGFAPYKKKFSIKTSKTPKTSKLKFKLSKAPKQMKSKNVVKISKPKQSKPYKPAKFKIAKTKMRFSKHFTLTA